MAIIGTKTDEKNLVLPEHNFNYFQQLFMFYLLKKTCFDGFSYDSNSANDE
jgi:hypothetical protein